MPSKEIRILVVDDDTELADMLVAYLDQLGYAATAAYDSRKGFELFQKSRYPLVITDLKMPEMDGIELMERIKATDRKTLVIVITGHGSIESAVEALKKGAYDFIPKPFKPEALKVIIDRAMDRHTLSSQVGVFRGLTLALIVSVPIWLILGIVLGIVWR